VTMQDEIRQGYKQTEVGVIPEDWEVKPLPTTLDFIGGKAHEQHIKAYGDFVVVNSKFISTEGQVAKYSDSNFCQARRGDILMVMSDLPNGKALAKCFVVDEDQKYAVNQRICILRPRNADSKFFFYQLNRNPYFMAFDDGVQQTHLLNGVFRVCPVIVPPTIEEQRAIAAALSDADALIAALEGMIAKKRDLKQAAMQHLLTGKTRLPGFSGEWEVKRLGDHVRFLKNGTLSRAQLMIDAPVKYLHYGDIHGSASLWLNPKSSGMPCVNPESVSSLDRLEHGDLIFADASEDLDGVGKSIEIVDYAATEVVSGLHTIAARFDKEVLADGFKAYLQFMPPFRDHLKSMAAGTKVLATNRKHIVSAILALPEPSEQTAIAEVLSDMDADLAALEAQAAKARAVKQGMMQELLTGRVRLV